MRDQEPHRLTALETVRAVEGWPPLNHAFVAVDIFTDPADIQQFICEYAEQVSKGYDVSPEVGKSIAISDALYFAGHKQETVSGNWFQVAEKHESS